VKTSRWGAENAGQENDGQNCRGSKMMDNDAYSKLLQYTYNDFGNR